MRKRAGRVALVMAVIGVASSCSSGGTELNFVESGIGQSSDEPAADSIIWSEVLNESTSFAPDVDATVDALFADHADEALDALVYALERGFTYGQISRGAARSVVERDGTFSDGTVPLGAAAGVVTLPDDVGPQGFGIMRRQLEVAPVERGPRVSPDDRRLTVDRLREDYGGTGNRPDEVLALAIAALARDGYSLEQITEAIVLGTASPVLRGEVGEPHMCLSDRTGKTIAPAVPIGDDPVCIEATTGSTTSTPTSDNADGAGSDLGGDSAVIGAAYTGSFSDAAWDLQNPFEAVRDNEVSVTFTDSGPVVSIRFFATLAREPLFYDGTEAYYQSVTERDVVGNCAPQIALESTPTPFVVSEAGPPTWTGTVELDFRYLINDCAPTDEMQNSTDVLSETISFLVDDDVLFGVIESFDWNFDAIAER